ncbi:MAG: GIY-YIG nuclease family protein [Melioribacteraceae bacterium]|nr:GIY-YIG nuclease family protein [Melioribacteraceae bacterium]
MSGYKNSDKLIKKSEFAVFDFETTGTSPQNSRVIEIGIVKVKNSKIVDQYSTLFNPLTELPFFITRLTGISQEDVDNAPLFEEKLPEIISFIGNSVLVAHNLSFDYSFLKKELQIAGYELPGNETMCTLKLARKLYPGLKSKSLGSLIKYFNIRIKKAHRAAEDARATAKVLIRMFDELYSEHNIETLDETIKFQASIPERKSFRLVKKSLLNDFSEIGEGPGVYLFKDREGNVIYIGKAKSLPKRVSNHFSSTAVRKSRKITQRAVRLEHIETNTELTALILEAELVKLHKPCFNSQLKKYSQNYFICFNKEIKYNIPKVTSKFDFDGNDYFGPYNSSDTARSMVDIVNRTFMLRECTDKELAKGLKCYLSDIERCLAPCITNSIEQYEEELRSVYDFLEGKNQHAVDRLLLKMKNLAGQKKYEEAAVIRDTINLILNQLHKTLILSSPVNNACVLVKIKGARNDDYILLVEGKVFIRNYILEHAQIFEQAVIDFYAGTQHLFRELSSKDLERLKIALSWFVKHRNRLSVYYLKEFDSADHLIRTVAMNQR